MIFYFPSMCFFIKTDNAKMIAQIQRLKQGLLVDSIAQVFGERVGHLIKFAPATLCDGPMRDEVDYEWAEVTNCADRRAAVTGGFGGRGVALRTPSTPSKAA